MNAEILVFVICVEAIIYLLLYNLHDCTFNMVDYIYKCSKWSVSSHKCALYSTMVSGLSDVFIVQFLRYSIICECL